MSEKILATVEASDFVGRRVELDALRQHADGTSKSSNGLWLLSPPGGGASELLRQTYDALYREPANTIPIYFAVGESDGTAKACARRFLDVFTAQTNAFQRRYSDGADETTAINEIAECRATHSDLAEDSAANRVFDDEEPTGDRAFVRDCLSAPLRHKASGAKFFVMIDDLHSAAYQTGEINFVEELKDVYAAAELRFVLAGRRRFLYEAARTGNTRLSDAEVLRLEPPNFAEAGLLAENLARRLNIKINEQARDLIARKFDGRPIFIKFLLQAASAARLDLDGFGKVEKVYTDEIFGGAIARFYDAALRRAAPRAETQKIFVKLIGQSLTGDGGKMPLEAWRGATDLNEADFYRVMSLLNISEIVRVSSNQVEAMRENETLNDYLTARFRLEIAAENRALVVGETLAAFLKRAPRTMAKFYRERSAIGLRELLSAFDNQETPLALIDYSAFAPYKGLPTAEIPADFDGAETIRLPQIVYTAHTSAFYPPLGSVTDTARSAVALGFAHSEYTDANETVWLAAEVDSKLEASRETAEFWCDRLEMVALVCNFKNYQLWLVAPEGFAPEASEVLRERNAYGSSRRQIERLVKFLKVESIVGEKKGAQEYEIVIPMGDDTELIAAHAVEEIAKRHSFSPKAINQIKTALVEACINATEHSLSPDRKIYQKFSFEANKLVVTISNRGLRFDGQPAAEITPDEGRRGWGLKLMKSLMDEVKFEQVDDGTRISMTKYLK